MVNIVILGSKEYPFGTNRGDDPLPGGGMETYVDDLVPELSKLCDVHIITRRFRGTKKYEKKDNVSVYRVPWLKGKWLRNVSFNFCSLLKGLSVARKADVIYSNGVISGLAALVIGKIARRKTVFRPAGIAFIQEKALLRNVLFALERTVMKKSDAVLFHSEGEMENARKHFNARLDNAHVILTGFPVEKFVKNMRNLRNELNLKDDIVISSVSRFVPVKGIDYIIRACSEIKGPYHLLLVGSGPEEERMKVLADDLGLGKNVTFTGFRRDIPEILATSDIFVVSSFSEGLPTSLLEAMAAGNACVVTDIGLPVEHMKTGIVVEPRNEISLRNALEALIKDSRLRERLGRKASEFAEKNCTQEMAAKKHLKLFRILLSS